MRFFGLTGGIASGKSTVAKRFAERGLDVVDADRLARDAVAPGTEGLAAVLEAFGESVLRPDGSLDRAALAAVVFADREKLRQLNAIVHPRVAALLLERGQALAAAGKRLACYEAALLVENGVVEAFRPLVVVAVPEAVQIARAAARDGCTPAEAEARVRAQKPLAEKVALADYVIDNAGPVEATLQRADEVLGAIRARYG